MNTEKCPHANYVMIHCPNWKGSDGKFELLSSVKKPTAIEWRYLLVRKSLRTLLGSYKIDIIIMNTDRKKLY